ncbi:MAG: hypothetical protein HYV23_07730 [Deltaproteobacteria bacterium]|nr:hypothetical protein [Deltaproteobacteria bacterium]
MKKALAAAAVVFSAVLVYCPPSHAVDTYAAGDAASGISTSRHNLGGTGLFTRAGNTTEICVYCHTPHHSNTLSNIKPLWNRQTEASLATYTAYGTTVAGTIINNTDLGSTTLACLSCHDGLTTFDNLVNAPGKNGVVENGTDRGWTFFTLDVVASDFMTSTRLNIGVSLSNDHPISVPYSDKVAGLRPTNTIINDIDLTTGLATSAFAYDNGNLNKNLWAVKGYISSTAQISDLLRETNGSMRVECSSCHDPHFNNKSWNEVDNTYTADNVTDLDVESNGLFLRRVGGNTGSGVCRTCHNK